MWQCKKCKKTWAYPIEKCIFCGEKIEDQISGEFIVEGITKVFVPSAEHKEVPYFVLLLKDENGCLHIKKTFKDYKIGQKFEEKVKKEKTTVAVSRVGYSIINATKKAIRLMGGITFKPNDKIFIKPNIVLAKSASTGVVTNPLVVEGIICYLLEKGVPRDNIIIGEGCLEGIDPEKAIKKAGYYDLCNKYGIKFRDIFSGRFIKKEIDDGEQKAIVEIAEEIFKADIIISVPVVKTHMQTGVSLGIKNIKGVINHQSRKTMHRSKLERQIAYLSKLIPRYITIADGSIGLEGMGPLSLGKPANLGLIIAGKDPVAVDTAICHIIGIKVPEHIKKAAELGLGEGDIKRINLAGEEIKVVQRKFEAADKRVSPHPDFEIIDGKPCSGCINSVWMTLHDLKEIPAETISVAIGSQILDEMIGYGKIIAIGNCALRALKNKGHEVEALEGCPPTEEQQKAFLKKWLKK